MFSDTGTLIYQDDPFKLIVAVSDEIGRYYRALIPPSFRVQRPLYPTHISVVRNEVPINVKAWKKYHGSELVFEYDSFIHSYGVYYWLNASSSQLENIRLELGLPNVSEYTKSPDSNSNFHITIGNTKHLAERNLK